jgi:hypothetical protein
MFKYFSLFPVSKPNPRGRKLIRELRRITHQRNFWRNRSLGRRGKRRR